MSKQFGANPTLGEEFMSSIVETQFAKTTLHPMVKIALVMTNCTTEKIVDSVAKLITKTDVAALKAKKMHPKVNEVESLLATFWENSRHQVWTSPSIQDVWQSLYSICLASHIQRENGHKRKDQDHGRAEDSHGV